VRAQGTLPQRIRTRYVIRGRPWQVKFKKWKVEKGGTWGMVEWSTKTIWLNERLKKYPFSLHETLTHELLHVFLDHKNNGTAHPRYNLGHSSLSTLVTKIERAKRTGVL
jgi:hypothetical protein